MKTRIYAAPAVKGLKRVKITHICFIWHQTFVNIDVQALITFPITGISSGDKTGLWL